MQGASLFYFTAFDSPQPRGIIPIENAKVTKGQRPAGSHDRRDKYLIRIDLDPEVEVARDFYLLSARSKAGLEGWIEVSWRSSSLPALHASCLSRHEVSPARTTSASAQSLKQLSSA